MSGTAVNSARWKSDAIVSSTDFSPLAEPNPSTVKPGLAASMSSTVVRMGSIRSTAPTPVSSSSYCTSTAWPSGETSFGSSSGERTRETPLAALRSATTSSTTALNWGLEAGSDSCSMNTDSPTVSSKPPLSTICSARRESPASASAGSRDLVPTTLPSATATTTNASHPKIAVLRWDALQRPMRAAMVLERCKGVMVGTSPGSRWPAQDRPDAATRPCGGLASASAESSTRGGR